ncbi:PREDICTED: transmembrane and TPR repeat-containing protein 2-like [Priapulus caudatus]|uniref:dolichyl-phosphate-mannose--protein mannosyltransferase n=1 Tax=Priapulus caudatus TaxID=37621 RepID=A0ABM1DUY2_PRICU|nr:PREDICTED: transmembrane and TPR repeat-containing protein 2-like [Priapulus caudatus]
MGLDPPEFAPSDNPASASDSLLTRTLTFLYLPALNAWLLLNPATLSFDWSMDAVPLVATPADARVALTALFYAYLAAAAVYVARNYAREGAPPAAGRARGGRSPDGHRKGVGNGVAAHANGGGAVANGGTTSNGAATTAAEKQKSIAAGGGLVRRLARRFARHAAAEPLPPPLAVGHSCGRSDRRPDDDRQAAPRPRADSVDVVVVAMSLIIFPFLLATNLFFYVGFVIAERVLYIPSMGFCLLVAHGKRPLPMRLGRWQHWLRSALLAALIGCYSVRTYTRNEDWRTEEALYRSGLSVNPAKFMSKFCELVYSTVLESHDDILWGRIAFVIVFRKQQFRGSLVSGGILLQEQKRYVEAISSYKTAIQCRPRLAGEEAPPRGDNRMHYSGYKLQRSDVDEAASAHMNLGAILHMNGKLTDAEKAYQEALALNPRDHITQDNLRKLRNLMQQLGLLGCKMAPKKIYAPAHRSPPPLEAIDVYHLAVERITGQYPPQSLYNMLGEAYFRQDKVDNAEMWYRKALQTKPDHIPAHLTLAKLLYKTDRSREAEALFRGALRLAPDDSSVYQHYGQYLAEAGQVRDAADMFVLAATLAPAEFEVMFNAANTLRGLHLEGVRSAEGAVALEVALLRDSVGLERASEISSAARTENRTRNASDSCEEVASGASAHMRSSGAILHINGPTSRQAEKAYQEALAIPPTGPHTSREQSAPAGATSAQAEPDT